MSPATVIKGAMADGVSLALSPSGSIKASGNQDAISRWLPMIRQYKPDIIAELKDAANDPAGNIPIRELTTAEESNLRAWLAHIGEDAPVLIAHCLSQCRSDPDALAYFLQRAREVPEDDRRYCRQCRKLTAGNKCRASKVSPVTDLAQRCEHYSPGPDDLDRRSGIERWPALGDGALINGDKSWH